MTGALSHPPRPFHAHETARRAGAPADHAPGAPSCLAPCVGLHLVHDRMREPTWPTSRPAPIEHRHWHGRLRPLAHPRYRPAIRQTGRCHAHGGAFAFAGGVVPAFPAVGLQNGPARRVHASLQAQQFACRPVSPCDDGGVYPRVAHLPTYHLRAAFRRYRGSSLSYSMAAPRALLARSGVNRFVDNRITASGEFANGFIQKA